jgi:hypothetical protein
MKYKFLTLLFALTLLFLSNESMAGKFIIRGGELYHVDDQGSVRHSGPQHYSEVTGLGAYRSTRYGLGVRWYNPRTNYTYGNSYLGNIGGHHQSWYNGNTTNHYGWGVGNHWYGHSYR